MPWPHAGLGWHWQLQRRAFGADGGVVGVAVWRCCAWCLVDLGGQGQGEFELESEGEGELGSAECRRDRVGIVLSGLVKNFNPSFL